MRKRSLSEFMCSEMLYDYKQGRLDSLRHQAVEDGLQASPKIREDLKKLSLGMAYVEKLKNVKVSEPLVDLILNQPRPTEKLISKFKWSELPQPVRWATEAVVVAVAIALFVTQMPDLFKSHKSEFEAVVVKKFDIKPEEEEVEVERKEESMGNVEQLAPKLAESTATVVIPQKVTEIAAEKAVEKVTEKPKAGNAYVYRAVIFVESVDKATPEIINIIKNLKGEKAGEVELGWRRKGGSYFHFSMPKENTVVLDAELKKYAQFNLVKSAHPRVMPENIERFIIWVEEKNMTSNQESQAKQEDAPVVVDPNTQNPNQETNE